MRLSIFTASGISLLAYLKGGARALLSRLHIEEKRQSSIPFSIPCGFRIRSRPGFACSPDAAAVRRVRPTGFSFVFSFCASS